MPVLFAALGKAAIGALISMLMSLASEAFFKDVFLMLGNMGAKSTKTKWDDKLVEKIEKALEEDDA